jgi:hypothetical protein
MVRWIPDRGPNWLRFLLGWTLGLLVGPLLWRFAYRPRLKAAIKATIEKRLRMGDLLGRRHR